MARISALLRPSRLALKERRIGRAWTDAVDVDSVPRQLACKRFGKRDQPALGCGVNGLDDTADPPDIARYVDDLASARGDH